MISLLHVVNELSLGGGTVHVCQLLKDTKNLGHRVGYATLEDGVMRKDLEDAGIPVFLMQRPEDLEDVAREFGANVLHGHTCGGGAYCCKIARKMGIVAGETVHSMVPGINPDADFEVVEVHKLHRVRPKSTLIYWAFHQGRFLANKGRKLIREELGIPADAPVIGRNGRLDGSKAPDEFVRCLAGLPECWGLLVGHGVEYDNLRRLAEELGCSERLVMPGMRRDQGDLFNAMDIVVYPTRDESVCAGVVEPLFCKKPVICYPVGGMDETIIHRKTGLHARSVDELVHYVRQLLKNPTAAQQLGEAGYQHVVSKGQHDPVGEARKHIELYQKLLGERK